MADRPLPKFKYMVGYKKCLEIENGVIIRMYWEHPTGNEDFDHIEVIQRWVEIAPNPDVDFLSRDWLGAHGFAISNVTRDGVRPLAAS